MKIGERVKVNVIGRKIKEKIERLSEVKWEKMEMNLVMVL